MFLEDLELTAEEEAALLEVLDEIDAEDRIRDGLLAVAGPDDEVNLDPEAKAVYQEAARTFIKQAAKRRVEAPRTALKPKDGGLDRLLQQSRTRAMGSLAQRRAR